MEEKRKKKNIKAVFLCACVFCMLCGMGLWLVFRTPDPYSYSERRTLTRKHVLTAQRLKSGKFMAEFEDYALDQFPLRDGFRAIKAYTAHYVFQKADNNGIYQKRGHLSKMEYPLNMAMLTKAAGRMQYVYDTYMKEKNITPYLAIIPDKNYFLAGERGVLSLDYDRLYETVMAQTDYMEYIEIKDLLALDDYYTTDTHWRQECIGAVAGRIGEQMNISLESLRPETFGYEQQTLKEPFYGVYYGQAALCVRPDTIHYLTNDTLEGCIVTSYDTGKPERKAVYDMEKAAGRDPYEMFLTGSSALLTIENPLASSDRELIVFRDSFGSSLIPLLIEGWQKITVIDLRYIQSSALGSFVTFENQDVLFLYSTLMLNNGLGGGN